MADHRVGRSSQNARSPEDDGVEDDEEGHVDCLPNALDLRLIRAMEKRKLALRGSTEANVADLGGSVLGRAGSLGILLELDLAISFEDVDEGGIGSNGGGAEMRFREGDGESDGADALENEAHPEEPAPAAKSPCVSELHRKRGMS